MLPVIAIVGRPNVGKSTLFNALTRSRDALVADRPWRRVGAFLRSPLSRIALQSSFLVPCWPQGPVLALQLSSTHLTHRSGVHMTSAHTLQSDLSRLFLSSLQGPIDDFD